MRLELMRFPSKTELERLTARGTYSYILPETTAGLEVGTAILNREGPTCVKLASPFDFPQSTASFLSLFGDAPTASKSSAARVAILLKDGHQTRRQLSKFSRTQQVCGNPNGRPRWLFEKQCRDDPWHEHHGLALAWNCSATLA